MGIKKRRIGKKEITLSHLYKSSAHKEEHINRTHQLKPPKKGGLKKS